MTDTIEIPVTYRDEERIFTAHILPYGYTYKLSVDIDGTEVQFEPDEEGGYRALVVSTEGSGHEKLNKELVGLLAQTLTASRG